MNAIDRAGRVRELARELGALLVGPDDDVTHFETRATVGDLLDALGVRSVVTWPDGSREWMFDDGLLVEEPARALVGMTLDPRVRDCGRTLARLLRGHADRADVLRDLAREVGVAAVLADPDDTLDRIDGAAVAYGEAIEAVDPAHTEAVTSVLLSLRGAIDEPRVRVPETWQAAVVHELGAVIRGPLRRGRFRVTEGTVDVVVRGNTLTAALSWDPEVVLRWPSPPAR